MHVGRGRAQNLIRNQQVVGSNPTGGSRANQNFRLVNFTRLGRFVISTESLS
jgi:hypothetical protein